MEAEKQVSYDYESSYFLQCLEIIAMKNPGGGKKRGAPIK